MNSPIKGKIVEILDDDIFVIDKGFADGIKMNNKLIVYEEGKMIHDLDGTEIEKLNESKGYLIIITIQEKISLATFRNSEQKYYFYINTTQGDELIIGNISSQLTNQINQGASVQTWDSLEDFG